MNHGKRAFIDPSMIRRESFMEKLLVDDATGCWNWQASKNTKGYGQFAVNGKVLQSHRVSYVMFYGSQPDLVLHSCDNPSCVNPQHLRSGNNAANMLEAQIRGRRPWRKGLSSIFDLVAAVRAEFQALSA